MPWFSHLVECFFKITLVCVEYNGFFLIVFTHHFEGDAWNSWLEISLFGIDHYTDVEILSSLLEITHTRISFIGYARKGRYWIRLLWQWCLNGESCYGTSPLHLLESGILGVAFDLSLDQAHGTYRSVGCLRQRFPTRGINAKFYNERLMSSIRCAFQYKPDLYRDANATIDLFNF